MASWLRGTVKEVVSGDTISIVGGKPGAAVPAEKRLTLSSLVAPKLGKRDSRDEPFAWGSREFLRKKLIGQVSWHGRRAAREAADRAPRTAHARPDCTPAAAPAPVHPAAAQHLAPPTRAPQSVVFKIDYVVEAIGNKEFGSVFLASPSGQQENIALSIVQSGWAKVVARARPPARARTRGATPPACAGAARMQPQPPHPPPCSSKQQGTTPAPPRGPASAAPPSWRPL